MLLLLLVEDLPSPHENYEFYGARALPSITGNGAYVQYHQFFYELVCTSTACKWNIMKKQLATSAHGAVMMYLPKDYTC